MRASMCDCVENMDIRACCEPNNKNKNSIKQFNKCGQKITTLYTLIFNDYNIYIFLEKRNDILNKEFYNKLKNILLKTNINEVTNNIYVFFNNSMLLTSDDIREAVNMISLKITITHHECEQIINFIIEDESL